MELLKDHSFEYARQVNVKLLIANTFKFCLELFS
jgi:hypothetical protein